MNSKLSLTNIIVSLAIIFSFLSSGVRLGNVFGFAILPVRIIGIICVAWLAVHLAKDNKKRIKTQYIIMTFSYMCFVTVLFSENYVNSVALLLDYLCVFSIFCVISLNIINQNQYKKYTTLFLICTIGTIIICFYEYITKNHIADNYTNLYSTSEWAYSYTIQAPTAFLYNPNNVAVLMVMSLPLSLEKAKDAKIITGKLLWTAVIILAMAVVFMTGSRGGLIAGIIVLGIYFISSDLHLWKKIIVIAIVMGVVFYFSTFIFKQLGYGGMLSKGQINIFAEGDGGRAEIAKASLNTVFKNNPIFGSGAGALENRKLISAHNTLIEILCNYGVVGMIVFVLLMFRLTKILLSQNKQIYSILLLISFFLTMFIPPTIMTLHVLFIPLALRVGRSYIKKEKTNEFTNSY